MTVGEKIRKLRKEKGLTQKQLGNLCDMADSAIRRYENGHANPKIETLRKIADVLGVDVVEFVQEQQTSETRLKTDKNRCDENNIASISFSTDEYTTDEMKQVLKFARFLKSDRDLDVNTTETDKEMCVIKLKQNDMQDQNQKKKEMDMELLEEVRRLQKLVRKYENEKSKSLEHIWVYKIEEWGCGVIFADDEDEAKERLIDTMSSSYSGFYEDDLTIQIDNAFECGILRPDHPHVVEVIECD